MIHGKRYIRVHGGVIYDEASHTATEYIEPDQDTWTGLYDHEGVPLHREREPIGYNPHRWSNAMPGPNQKKKPMKTKKKGKC